MHEVIGALTRLIGSSLEDARHKIPEYLSSIGKSLFRGFVSALSRGHHKQLTAQQFSVLRRRLGQFMGCEVLDEIGTEISAGGTSRITELKQALLNAQKIIER